MPTAQPVIDGIGQENARPPSASVIIACYSLERWPLLERAVESALRQTISVDVIVVVDHNAELARRVAERWPHILVLENDGKRGASGARNAGAMRTSTEMVLFLDDDACADPEWAQRLTSHLADSSVVGVGGGVTADWATGRPSWFPDEFAWIVGASYLGMPQEVSEIRNVWAENMGVRAEVFRSVSGFRDGFGKIGLRSSPEDTDLCIRMADSGGRWLYDPEATVAHHVPAERSTFRFFLRRSFAEGRGKAELARLVSHKPLAVERQYVRSTIPRAFARYLYVGVRRRDAGPLRTGAALMAGLGCATAGYLCEQAIQGVHAVSTRGTRA